MTPLQDVASGAGLRASVGFGLPLAQAGFSWQVTVAQATRHSQGLWPRGSHVITIGQSKCRSQHGVGGMCLTHVGRRLCSLPCSHRPVAELGLEPELVRLGRQPPTALPVTEMVREACGQGSTNDSLSSDHLFAVRGSENRACAQTHRQHCQDWPEQPGLSGSDGQGLRTPQGGRSPPWPCDLIHPPSAPQSTLPGYGDHSSTRFTELRGELNGAICGRKPLEQHPPPYGRCSHAVLGWFHLHVHRELSFLSVKVHGAPQQPSEGATLFYYTKEEIVAKLSASQGPDAALAGMAPRPV